MSGRRIRSHYDHMTVLERGRVIGLREAGWAYQRIARHLGRREGAIRRC